MFIVSLQKKILKKRYFSFWQKRLVISRFEQFVFMKIRALSNRHLLIKFFYRWKAAAMKQPILRKQFYRVRKRRLKRLKYSAFSTWRYKFIKIQIEYRHHDLALRLHEKHLIKRCWKRWKNSFIAVSKCKYLRHLRLKRTLKRIFTKWRRHAKRTLNLADQFYRTNLLSTHFALWKRKLRFIRYRRAERREFLFQPEITIYDEHDPVYKLISEVDNMNKKTSEVIQTLKHEKDEIPQKQSVADDIMRMLDQAKAKYSLSNKLTYIT